MYLTSTWTPGYNTFPVTTSPPFAASVFDGTLPVEDAFFTRAEAMEVARRARPARGRARVFKRDGKWVVAYRTRPVAIN